MSDISTFTLGLQRGYYMSVHVLLNLSNQLWKRDQMQGWSSILGFFSRTLINSVIKEMMMTLGYKYHMTLKLV